LGASLLIDSANFSNIVNGIREFDERKLDDLAIQLDIEKDKIYSEHVSQKFAKKYIIPTVLKRY
jgi:hypothetical protein